MSHWRRNPPIHWTALNAGRAQNSLTGNALLGQLWWWRAGQPAPDLWVDGATSPELVDWSGFPTDVPRGYAQPPKRRASGFGVSKSQEERRAKVRSFTMSEEAFERLGELAVYFGGNKSATVEHLIMTAIVQGRR